MWHDVETTTDLLNFSIVAETAAELIRGSNGQPISIGISGNWGTGKSSLVKMIGGSLKKSDKKKTKYIFLEFDAWLYQGYDDARMALLQSVADKLIIEANQRKTAVDKAIEFAKRINWLRVGKLMAPIAAGALAGSITGPQGALIGVLAGLFQNKGVPTADEFEKAKDAFAKLLPEMKGVINQERIQSLPKEIAEVRNQFQDILEELNVILVIMVDDLDRCLPDTAISTLEAMRLLLFLPNTAFIIAADEQMIRASVRSHFGAVNLNDDIVTSYFDKLIQVPLRVPRLGANEVKAYLILLFADLAERDKRISAETRVEAQTIILEALRKSWEGGLTKKKMEEAFGTEAAKIATEIELSDRLANIMTTSEQISGNPRLIKRFLNNLLIRSAVAKAQGMSVGFEELVKLQLFERCAPPAAFEYLAKKVAESKDGKVKFIEELETKISNGEPFQPDDSSWNNPFIENWISLPPSLANVDLRPLMYLSREKSLSIACFDELSSDGQEIFEALIEARDILPHLKTKLMAIGETECNRILARLKNKARSEQWTAESLIRCLNIINIFSSLIPSFISLLNEIPAEKRPTALIPHIRSEQWAQELLKAWAEDKNSPKTVITAINIKRGAK